MESWPETPSPQAGGAFWRFSLGLYARPGVAACCLDLQDRLGRDVNLLLFAAWVGASGRGRLSLADLARAEAAVAPWRREAVEPLRALRRRVREEPESAELYAAVKAAELKAEEIAQRRLETQAPPPGPGAPAAARLADALANVALYLGGEVAAPLRAALAADVPSA